MPARRWFGYVGAAFLAAVAMALTLLLVGEAADRAIGAYTRGYYRACYPDLHDRFPELDYPHKLVWGNLLIETAVWGFWSNGIAAFILLALRLGTIMTLARAYFVVCLTGLVGGVVGGGIGYVLGITIPGYYRGVFRSGGEAWFDPIQVGIGLGISQGLLASLAVGAAVVVAVALRTACLRPTTTQTEG
jgi:hypothetical protein